MSSTCCYPVPTKLRVFVEEHHITLGVNWAWRELLVQCEMEDHPTEDIPDDLERFDILDDVFDILCAPEQDGKVYLGSNLAIPRCLPFVR